MLRDFGRGDWELAGMVCQTLWNYSGKISSTNATFGEQEAQELIEILIDYLGKFVVSYCCWNSISCTSDKKISVYPRFWSGVENTGLSLVV